MLLTAPRRASTRQRSKLQEAAIRRPSGDQASGISRAAPAWVSWRIAPSATESRQMASWRGEPQWLLRAALCDEAGYEPWEEGLLA
jgi:hypothetical protein